MTFRTEGVLKTVIQKGFELPANYCMVVFICYLIIPELIVTANFSCPGKFRDMPSMDNFFATAHGLSKFGPLKIYGKKVLIGLQTQELTNKLRELISTPAATKSRLLIRT